MKKLLILSAVVTALASYGAMAADANINFTGAVSSTTCKLNAVDAAKTLTIPNVSPQTLLDGSYGSAGVYSASGSFDFTDCPAGLTKVTSAYTYESGALWGADNDWGVANGVSHVSFHVYQDSKGGNQGTHVRLDGIPNGANEATITNGAATIPVTVGVAAVDLTGFGLPTAGNYTGTFLVAFTYS
ncbi:TPA: fimbrial protein [Enterobacter asburiae]